MNYRLFVFLFLLFNTHQLVMASRYDSPAILLKDNERYELTQFSKCIRGGAIRSIWNDLSTSFLTSTGFSNHYTPNQIVIGWFETFENKRYSGMLQKLLDNINYQQDKRIIHQALSYANEVENAAYHFDLVIRAIDLSVINRSSCRRYSESAYQLVDAQRDFSLEWVKGIRFLSRRLERYIDANKAKKNVMTIYNKLKKHRSDMR